MESGANGEDWPEKLLFSEARIADFIGCSSTIAVNYPKFFSTGLAGALTVSLTVKPSFFAIGVSFTATSHRGFRGS